MVHVCFHPNILLCMSEKYSTKIKPEIVMVAAIAKNNAIGLKGKLLYRIPEDLKRFKNLTWGYPVVMGRITFQTLPGPLPGRRNLVLSSDPLIELGSEEFYFSKEGILDAVKGEDRVYIIGGGSIYSQFIQDASRLELTIIDDYPDSYDTVFPDFLDFGFSETWREDHITKDGLKYSFTTYERTMPILSGDSV